MSIIGIGIDIIQVSRIKKMLYYYGDKFPKRILSNQEWNEYHSDTNHSSFLAKKFAAKEAALKALGTGVHYGITFNQIEFYKNKLGQPKLRFLNNALKQSKKINSRMVHVSITDETLYACALVILED